MQIALIMNLCGYLQNGYNFIIGRDAVDTNKGNKGTKEAMKEGKSIETVTILS